MVMAFMLYATRLEQLDFGPVPYSVTDPQSVQLFDAIRKLPLTARVLSRKPTIIALFTGHASIIWPEQCTDAELTAFIRRSNLEYIVQDYPHLGVALHDPDPLDAYIDRNRSQLEPVFADKWFRVFRVKSVAAAATAYRVAPKAAL